MNNRSARFLLCACCLLTGLILAFSAKPARAQGEAAVIQPIISEIQVTIESVPGEGENLDILPAHLIFLKKGQPFSPERLEKSIQALKMSQRFEQIEIDSNERGSTIALFFKLVPFRLIFDIQVRGQRPLFERDVLNALTVQPGDPYKPDALSKQAELVAAVYRRQGFPDAKVEIVDQTRPADGFIELVVSIERGDPAQLSELSIIGNRAISETRILNQFATWRRNRLTGGFRRFSEQAFKADLDALRAFYRRQGFFRINTSYKLTTDPHDQRVSARVTIDEGPHYTIEFSGNEQLSDRTLEKVISPLLAGYVGPSTFNRAVRELKQRYEADGFQNADITLQRTESLKEGMPVEHVRFTVAEGPRTLVNSVAVVGNRKLSTEVIMADVLTRPPELFHSGAFDPATLKKDLVTLQRLYLQNGFLTATIEEHLTFSADSRQVDVTLAIDEGPRTVVAAVNLPAGMPISKSEALAAMVLKPGAAFREYMLTSDQNALEGLISQLGYPHVKAVAQPRLSDDQRQITLNYTVESGPRVTLGEIFYLGNFRTKRRVLNRALDFKPGQPFALKSTLEAQRTLRNMEALSSVRFDTFGLATRSPQVFIFARVVERKPYFVEIGGGYQSDKGFFGLVKTGDLNITGRNKALQLGGQVSQVGHRLELELTEPRLFNNPTRATLSTFWDRKAEFNQVFGIEVVGTALSVTRNYWENFDVGLKLQHEYRDEFIQSGEDRPADMEDSEFDPRNVMVTTPALRYDTRDSIIQPRQGFLCGAGIDIAKGLENSLDDFLRYKLDAHYYYSPLERLTLAAVARAGLIDPYGDKDSVPSDQLFYLGGTLDVRGYGENEFLLDEEGNPQGGRRAVSGSVEARIYITRGFELTLFYDIGRLSLADGGDASEGFRDSVGAGLRYITAIGPIGFMYGHKLDPQPGEPSGRWHFSIGYTF